MQLTARIYTIIIFNNNLNVQTTNSTFARKKTKGYTINKYSDAWFQFVSNIIHHIQCSCFANETFYDWSFFKFMVHDWSQCGSLNA